MHRRRRKKTVHPIQMGGGVMRQTVSTSAGLCAGKKRGAGTPALYADCDPRSAASRSKALQHQSTHVSADLALPSEKVCHSMSFPQPAPRKNPNQQGSLCAPLKLSEQTATEMWPASHHRSRKFNSTNYQYAREVMRLSKERGAQRCFQWTPH